MGGKSDALKKAFGTKNKNRQRAARRAGKIEAKLDSLNSSLSDWEAAGTRANWSVGYRKAICEETRGKYAALRDAVSGLKDLAESKPGKAYEQMGELKGMLKDLEDRINKHQPKEVPGAPQPLSPQIVPGFEDRDDDTDVVQMIADKISGGKEKLQELRALDSMSEEEFQAWLEENPPTRKEVADICWYLRTMSEAVVGEPWRKGAMQVPDPNGRLRHFLDHTAEVYGRKSSHLTKDQKAEHGEGQARGIDFYEGAKGEDDLLLPYGMTTFLFQRLDRTEKDGDEASQFLYLKMETEGARISPGFKRSGDTPQSRNKQLADVTNSIKHGKNLVIKEKDKSELARRAEKLGDVPARLTSLYEDLLDASTDYYAGLKNALLEDAKVKQHKVRKWKKKFELQKLEVNQMWRNILEVEKLIEELREVGDDTTFAEIEALIGQFREEVDRNWGKTSEEKMWRRVGNEVVLDEDDLMLAEDDGNVEQLSFNDPDDVEVAISEGLRQRFAQYPRKLSAFLEQFESDEVLQEMCVEAGDPLPRQVFYLKEIVDRALHADDSQDQQEVLAELGAVISSVPYVTLIEILHERVLAVVSAMLEGSVEEEGDNLDADRGTVLVPVDGKGKEKESGER